MKKKTYVILCVLCLVLLLNACGGIPVAETIDPASVLTRQIQNTDQAYEWKELPWDTTKAKAMKKLKNHTWFLNLGDQLSYIQDSTLSDGTPVKTKLNLGFRDKTDEGTLNLIQWVFFVEDTDGQRGSQLYQTFCDQLQTWMDGEELAEESRSETAAMARKPSGSAIEISWDTISNESYHEFDSTEYPEYATDLWQHRSRVVIQLTPNG